MEASEWKTACPAYEILKAFQAGDKNLVLKKQYELTRSFAARAIAIRTITSNKGKNTAGLDGITLSTYSQKLEYIFKLKNLKNYQTSPVKRIYIPKEHGKSKRLLGILTMFDRACGVKTFLYPYYFAIYAIVVVYLSQTESLYLTEFTTVDILHRVKKFIFLFKNLVPKDERGLKGWYRQDFIEFYRIEGVKNVRFTEKNFYCVTLIFFITYYAFYC